MQVGKILDPELHGSSIELEIEAILHEVNQVQWRMESRSNLEHDDRVFMDVTGFGADIYMMFCEQYPELKNRIIPMHQGVGKNVFSSRY